MKSSIIILMLLSGFSAMAQVEKLAHVKGGDVVSVRGIALPATIKETRLQFQGYKLRVLSDAMDDLGNHMLLGNIDVLDTAVSKRDTFISHAIPAWYPMLHGADIILATDKNYKPLGLVLLGDVRVVKYNKAWKKFIVGYVMNKGRWDENKYETCLFIADIDFKGKLYIVRTDHSSYLEDFLVQGSNIHVFGRVGHGDREARGIEKLDIVTVDTNKTHPSDSMPNVRVFDPVNVVQTIADDKGDLDLSDLAVVDNAVYFSTSNADQYRPAIKNRIYRFEAGKLEEQDLENAPQIHQDDRYLVIGGFHVNQHHDYFLATNRVMEKKIRLIRTDNRLQVERVVEVENFTYPAWRTALELSNGTVIMACEGANGFWQYKIFNRDLELVKELGTQVPNKYHLQKFEVTEGDKALMIFNPAGIESEKPVIIQTLDLAK